MELDTGNRELTAGEVDRVEGGNIFVAIAAGIATNAIYDAIKGRERLPVDQWIEIMQRYN